MGVHCSLYPCSPEAREGLREAWAEQAVEKDSYKGLGGQWRSSWYVWLMPCLSLHSWLSVYLQHLAPLFRKTGAAPPTPS